MKRFKNWLYRRYLPEWCREELIGENERLTSEMAEIRQDNERLRAYIRGVQSAMRAARKIVVVTGGEAYGHMVGSGEQPQGGEH